ncbi:hypothetical protein [Methylobacterium sp. BTF04]|nr:hypothetical protein [Methylobacterium sp. BTF04]
MTEIAARETQTHDLWQSIPLELAVSVAAVIVAGCLKFMGMMP